MRRKRKKQMFKKKASKQQKQVLMTTDTLKIRSITKVLNFWISTKTTALSKDLNNMLEKALLSKLVQ